MCHDDFFGPGQDDARRSRTKRGLKLCCLFGMENLGAIASQKADKGVFRHQWRCDEDRSDVEATGLRELIRINQGLGVVPDVGEVQIAKEHSPQILTTQVHAL